MLWKAFFSVGPPVIDLNKQTHQTMGCAPVSLAVEPSDQGNLPQTRDWRSSLLTATLLMCSSFQPFILSVTARVNWNWCEESLPQITVFFQERMKPKRSQGSRNQPGMGSGTQRGGTRTSRPFVQRLLTGFLQLEFPASDASPECPPHPAFLSPAPILCPPSKIPLLPRLCRWA